jgi:hypothetical protein
MKRILNYTLFLESKKKMSKEQLEKAIKELKEKGYRGFDDDEEYLKKAKEYIKKLGYRNTDKEGKDLSNESMMVDEFGNLEIQDCLMDSSEDNPDTAYEKGKEAYYRNFDENKNPFTEPELKQAWFDGYTDR